MEKISENDLCLCLFQRHRNKSFHWAFVIPTDMKKGIVTKIHATQLRPGAVFEYEAIAHPGFFHSVNPQVRLITKLGQVNSVEDVQKLLKDTDMRTNRKYGGRKTVFDCKIWIRQAVDILHENQMIVCSDAVALEEKCQTVAETSTTDCLIGVWDDAEKDIVFN